MPRFFAIVLGSAWCAAGMGCRPRPTFSTAPRPTAAPVAAPAAPGRAGVAWTHYHAPRGCAFDVYAGGRPPTVIDAPGELASALVRVHPESTEARFACTPEGAGREFDFSRSRIVFAPIDGGGGQRIDPVAVTPDAGSIVVSVSVAPDCGGAERGPGFLLILIPAGAEPVEVRNLDTTRCSCPDGDCPA
jgi:hypothetical protein